MNNIYDKTKDDPQPAAPDRYSSLSGSVSKHFRIGKSLGSGFYGEILSVWDKTTGSRASVRVIKSKWNHQIDNIDEISKCMNLRHENLVCYKSLILIGSPDIKALGLEMSLCLAPVRSLLPLSISECCFVIRGVVSGLAFLHTRGIVHANVRPASVFLHDSGAVRLGDYGLYLLAPKRRDPWESPELRSTMKMAPTASCDIWSLGITVCHFLLGSLPYKHFKLSSPAEKLPAEVKMSSLGKFIDKCLNPDPDQRPTASFLMTLEVMMDECLAGAEMGLDMVRWLQIRPELRDRDMGEVKERLDCDNCGKDTGYSPAFRLEHGPEFLCDDCLEKRSGHRDCQKQTEDCRECSELGKTLRQRWRRHQYLETAQSSHRNEQNNSPNADTDQNMDLDCLDVDPVPKKCADVNREKNGGLVDQNVVGVSIIDNRGDKSVEDKNNNKSTSTPYKLRPKQLVDCEVCLKRARLNKGFVTESGDFICDLCITKANSVY